MTIDTSEHPSVTLTRLKNKLSRACAYSGLSVDEQIHAMVETLVDVMNFEAAGHHDGEQQLRRMARHAAVELIDGVTGNFDEAAAFIAELAELGKPSS